MGLPTVAFTMGDAAGIGPEIVVKSLLVESLYEQCRPVVVGAPRVLADACRMLRAGPVVRAVSDISEASPSASVMDVLVPKDLELPPVTPGKLDRALGRAAALCLAEAMRLAQAGAVRAIVAAPMSKEAFQAAGYAYHDELEYLADLTHSLDTFMLSPLGNGWVVRATGHVPFREIAGLLTRECVLGYIVKLHTVLAGLGHERPRIAVAALNPHCGEGGRTGSEEVVAIAPAIADACARGIAAKGPLPADTVFASALAGRFDGVVAMYHDQANIACKFQPMSSRATLFMGLPVPCATTGHGTAFDIAGKGVADPGSLLAACKYAIMLSAVGTPDRRATP